jgi:hypothetical protein
MQFSNIEGAHLRWKWTPPHLPEVVPTTAIRDSWN